MIAKYSHKRVWKLALLAAAVVIGVSSVVYTNYLAQKLAKKERDRIELIVETTRQITELEDPNDESMNFLGSIIKRNTSIPVIVTDSLGTIVQHRNLDSVKALDSAYLKKKLAELKTQNQPVFLPGKYFSQYFYYGDSPTLVMLRYYPYIQLIIIALFIMVSYLAFSSSRRFEQNQVWVGMSKETAHQLGTPLSSLMAWVEVMRSDDNIPDQMVTEIEKDVNRLEVITDRFSKVGAQPVLELLNLFDVVSNAIVYLQTRVSRKVEIKVDVQNSDQVAQAFLNTSLFEWVIENLCKNAVDAMEGKGGSITFKILNKIDHVQVDVIDTGKGIPIYLQKTVFNPGYTTRKRGWGLGLSLAKRIIESYHNGQIFVQHSEPKAGTTFRIKIPKENTKE